MPRNPTVEEAPQKIGYNIPKTDLMRSPLEKLPWDDMVEISDKSSVTQARNALERYLKFKRGIQNPTVGDVLRLFDSVAAEGEPVDYISGYGPGSYQITREVFSRAGLKLHEVNVPKK